MALTTHDPLADPAIEDTLRALGLDEPSPRHLAHLVACLLVEPDVLAHWTRTSQHPRLVAAYDALRGRVTERAERVRDLFDDHAITPHLDAAMEHARREGRSIDHELTRLKWLQASRTARHAARDAFGAAYPATEDANEAETLQELITQLHRKLC